MKFSMILLLAIFGIVCGQNYRKPYFPDYRSRYNPAYRQTGLEKYARTLKENFDLTDNGAYQYAFETDNGISAQEIGYPKLTRDSPPSLSKNVQGAFSWTSPEGKVVSIGYVADENGYRPFGDAIPTPHPIPDYILKSIEFNKREEAKRAAAARRNLNKL